MTRGPLSDQDYKPTFSGHETFPLRYGWLKKAYDAVSETERYEEGNRFVFAGEDAIARFGVGKNMVAAIRHWAVVSSIIKGVPGETNRLRTTNFGELIFGEYGIDPYLESPSTLWLIHWLISGRPRKTSFYWLFNHFNEQTFSKDRLLRDLGQLCSQQGWQRIANTTLKRDVECLLQTYSSKSAGKRHSPEDAIECPLAELGLLVSQQGIGTYHMARGPKPTLGDGVFAFALLTFWIGHTSARTITFETLAHEPGSPGRIFLLDEDDLAERLMRIAEITGGLLEWSETSGLKQLIATDELSDFTPQDFIVLDYPRFGGREAA